MRKFWSNGIAPKWFFLRVSIRWHEQYIAVIRHSRSLQMRVRESVNNAIAIMITTATVPSVETRIRTQLNHSKRSSCSGKGVSMSARSGEHIYIEFFALTIFYFNIWHLNRMTVRFIRNGCWFIILRILIGWNMGYDTWSKRYAGKEKCRKVNVYFVHGAVVGETQTGQFILSWTPKWSTCGFAIFIWVR